MKMTILAKPFLSRLKRAFLFLALSLLGANAFAEINANALFVPLSDALSAEQQNQAEEAITHLHTLQREFQALDNHDSVAGVQVSDALNSALDAPSKASLTELSKALYAFEKEQNPIDYTAKRKKFAQRVLPVYHELQTALTARDIAKVEKINKRLNSVWTLNEKVVRDTSLGHYGQIETAMSFFRIAMLAEPPDYAAMQTQYEILGTALTDFNAGNILQPQVRQGEAQTLPEGIALLEDSLQDFQDHQPDQGKDKLALFIAQWPIFEGDVRTRDGALYSRVESELPVILSRGDDPQNIAQLQNLIDSLSAIDVSAQYGILDAALILLREGLEALLIVIALLTALNAAGQSRAKNWVYGGAGLGVAASIAGAVALQRLFPAVSAGTSREILEGGVGIVAVIMMLFIGGWLHSKASLRGWQRFVNQRIAKALTTGSLISLLSLSFLAVFREGAETILFYAGILPRIALSDLLLGIALALILLLILALAIAKSTNRLPIHQLFRAMTVLIYVLGFKVLGVSIYALQLTKVLPMHLVNPLPDISLIGFYPTWEGIGAQTLYLALIPLVRRLFQGREPAPKTA